MAAFGAPIDTSDLETDVANAYEQYANCYITKPILVEDLQRVCNSITEYWLRLAKLPPNKR